jgi:hypothetical protein
MKKEAVSASETSCFIKKLNDGQDPTKEDYVKEKINSVTKSKGE